MKEKRIVGAISNQFKDSLIQRVVERTFNEAGAGTTIGMSTGVKNNLGGVDTDGDGRMSRDELTLAMTKGNVKLSFENGGRANYGLAREIVNYLDAADGTLGGQIRVSNADVDADLAAKNLASGKWVLGKALEIFDAGDKRTIELHQNADGPKFTLPGGTAAAPKPKSPPANSAAITALRDTAMADYSSAVKESAIRGLGQYRTKESVKAIFDISQTTYSESLKVNAIEQLGAALGQVGDAGYYIKELGLASYSSSTKISAIKELGRYPSSDNIRHIQSIAESSYSSDVKQTAIRAIAGGYRLR